MARYYRYYYPRRGYYSLHNKLHSNVPKATAKSDSENEQYEINKTNTLTPFDKLPDFIRLIAKGQLDKPLLRIAKLPVFLDDIILVGLILLFFLDGNNDDITLILLLFLLIAGKDFTG